MQHAAVENGAAPAFRTLHAVLDRFADICKSSDESEYFEDVASLFPKELYSPGPPMIRLMTGQADGVDEYAIEVAHDLGLTVDLVAPGTLRADYDAVSARSVGFGCPLERLRTDDAPFAMRDELAFSYADMLVAVWDGGPAHGTAGGVVRLIQRAVLAGLPVLWIDLEGKLWTIEADRVTEECLYRLRRRELDEGLLGSLFKHRDLAKGVLIDPLRRRLNPLDGNLVVPSGETEMLARYASECRGWRMFERRAGSFHELMAAIFRLDVHESLCSVWKWICGECATQKQEDPVDGPAPNTAEDSRLATPDGLQARFEWSDARANVAGGRHRSSIWNLYMLSSAAVFASVMGIVNSGITWPLVEIVFIASIIGTFCVARRRDWHRIWLGHRFVAEQIRYLQILRPFLAIPAPFQAPLFVHSDSRRAGHRLRSAERWILQRALSADGLPSEYKGYDLASADRGELVSKLRQEVNLQARFHKRAHKYAKRLREVAEDWVAGGLFWLVLGCTIVHVILRCSHVEVPLWVEPCLQVFSASAPALAAALHGVMTKLEIGRIAAQSHKVRSRLLVLDSVVSNDNERHSLPDWISMARLRADAMEVASLLSEENEQWRDLIRYQETEIPA
ncbi:hypothetical protein DLM46_14905 [Paraburkholderia lacunae]|uniref:Uncharacterized protein n=2 Tax=Paraburkholderia lacunae TaxID=2211104 RepID=A0A370N9K0_9BURK|nr:hypothetical protein DLM46_14905 [Paraburkholderia lacunae]